MADARIRIGISACLLGQAVRFDGGHKRDAFLTDILGPFVEWVPVCPEVEVGMGVPREAVHLVRSAGSSGTLRMIAVHTGVDHTDRMNAWAERRVADLSTQRLSGYVLKQNSPSCGLAGVKVQGAGGAAEPSGRGLFATVLKEKLPSLPVEEEGRLADPRIRESFIERVFAYRRCQEPDRFDERYEQLLIDMLAAVRNHV